MQVWRPCLCSPGVTPDYGLGPGCSELCARADWSSCPDGKELGTQPVSQDCSWTFPPEAPASALQWEQLGIPGWKALRQFVGSGGLGCKGFAEDGADPLHTPQPHMLAVPWERLSLYTCVAFLASPSQ